LHGLGYNKEFGRHLLATIPDCISGVSLDIPGASDVQNFGLRTFNDYAGYINSFIEKEVAGKYIVLGFSFGGLITLHYNDIYSDPDNIFNIVWDSPVTGLNSKLNLLKLTLKGLKPTSDFRKRALNFISQRTQVKLSQEEICILSDIKAEDAINSLELIDNEQFVYKNLNKVKFIYGQNDIFLKEGTEVFVKNKVSIEENVQIIPGAQHFGEEKGWDQAYDYILSLLKNSI